MIISKELENNIITYYKSGLSVLKVSNLTNLKYNRIRKIILESNVKMRPKLRSNIYKISNNTFEEIDSEEKSYILGFICADGYNQISKNRVGIRLSIVDIDILEKIRDFFIKKLNLFLE